MARFKPKAHISSRPSADARLLLIAAQDVTNHSLCLQWDPFEDGQSLAEHCVAGRERTRNLVVRDAKRTLGPIAAGKLRQQVRGLQPHRTTIHDLLTKQARKALRGERPSAVLIATDLVVDPAEGVPEMLQKAVAALPALMIAVVEDGATETAIRITPWGAAPSKTDETSEFLGLSWYPDCAADSRGLVTALGDVGLTLHRVYDEQQLLKGPVWPGGLLR